MNLERFRSGVATCSIVIKDLISEDSVADVDKDRSDLFVASVLQLDCVLAKVRRIDGIVAVEHGQHHRPVVAAVILAINRDALDGAIEVSIINPKHFKRIGSVCRWVNDTARIDGIFTPRDHFDPADNRILHVVVQEIDVERSAGDFHYGADDPAIAASEECCWVQIVNRRDAFKLHVEGAHEVGVRSCLSEVEVHRDGIAGSDPRQVNYRDCVRERIVIRPRCRKDRIRDVCQTRCCWRCIHIATVLRAREVRAWRRRCICLPVRTVIKGRDCRTKGIDPQQDVADRIACWVTNRWYVGVWIVLDHKRIRDLRDLSVAINHTNGEVVEAKVVARICRLRCRPRDRDCPIKLTILVQSHLDHVGDLLRVVALNTIGCLWRWI